MSCIEITLVYDKSILLFKENQIKINDIKTNLEEYKKNPNFYRNKKILAVAVAIVAIVAVAILAYFCWGVYLPFCIGKIGTGTASGLAISRLAIIPVGVAVGGYLGVSYLFRSHASDNKALAKLEAEQESLKQKIQSQIMLCERKNQLAKQQLQAALENS